MVSKDKFWKLKRFPTQGEVEVVPGPVWCVSRNKFPRELKRFPNLGSKDDIFRV